MSAEATLNRPDFRFHEGKTLLGVTVAIKSDTLESLGVGITHGSLSRTDFLKAGLYALTQHFATKVPR